MSSSVFFKFKSQKEPSRVEFDGTGISVFELKRDIIIKSGLGDGTDFDLAIYNEDGKEEYDDDTTIIPRSTSVVARRLPPIKAGAGRAARYMSGKMPVNAKNSSRKEQSKSIAKPASASNSAAQMSSAMTEEERMAAMFAAQSEQWSAQQEEMANQTPVFRPGGNKKGQPPANVPDHEPPTGYICYRCGEKGHWIQVCPTNDDPNFDNKPRVKRTTGIPRSFLKTVEKPVQLSNDGTTDDTKAPSGVMVNAEGEFVIAEPDKASWEKFQAKTKSSAAAKEAAALGDKELQDRGLECAIDKRIFIDPMKTPCCEKTYCNDCITNALIDSDFTCPGCQTDGVLLDDLKPDPETSRKIKEYLDEKSAAKKEKARSKSPSVKPESTPTETKEKLNTASSSPKSPQKPKSPQSATASPKPETALVTSEVSVAKKRPADELLENPKIPKAPKAMQKQQQQAALLQQQQAMMNGMNPMASFPMNMPMPMNMNQNPNMNIGMYGGGYGGMPNMMNGFGMGLNSGMPNMMGMNPMMNMNGFGGGYPNMNNLPNMNGMNMYGNGYGGGMGNMNMMNGNMGGPVQPSNGAGAAGGFQNQQKTVFAEPLPNEEDNAYFRKPVNPHRHQGRQRRARPSDYREL
ncbi:retinoblastoma-binding protein [Phlyctema vagabunda]|uniref:Retinoblastoma-binding protein n=1 Tax=Phlyctema vagabunda TaxID=108571 RepID=A0ABR4PML2_9HELO